MRRTLASATLIIAIVLMMTGCGSESESVANADRRPGEQWYDSGPGGAGQYKCQALKLTTGDVFDYCVELDWQSGDEEKIENEEVGFFASVKNWFKGDAS